MSLAMNCPGMGDPTKRRKTLRFLAMTAVIARNLSVFLRFVGSPIPGQFMAKLI